MRAIAYSLVLVMGLAWASSARADLAVQPVAVPAAVRPVASDSASDSPIAAHGFAARALSTAGLLGDQPWAGLPVVPTASDGEKAVRELPALPSSASLFLSAVLTVGAWHTMRKAGQLHLANLPEWYHADAPYQIGHTVVFDPTFSLELLPACLSDIHVDAEPARFPDTPREIPSRFDSQHLLTIESPRAPPALA